ncbi:unnamed protein product [Nippostrongylus brasiliensis]|uniref:26S protease regulatory subunit 7 (inferred by orthology to a C. elegans protein) n=1 Tax=Nippostrongylus brasiliensis TaxID=27835 RepID=A0A0N4XM38_NIPBR|nr:unnamed protein product [Nippostrongylus brasiliensis]
MPDHLGSDMRKQKKDVDAEEDKPFQALDEGDIAVLKRYGQGPYAEQLKQLETDIEECVKKKMLDFTSFRYFVSYCGAPN